jgi:hypothetical protein
MCAARATPTVESECEEMVNAGCRRREGRLGATIRAGCAGRANCVELKDADYSTTTIADVARSVFVGAS